MQRAKTLELELHIRRNLSLRIPRLQIYWQNRLPIGRPRPLLIFWHLHTHVTTPTLAESLLINSKHSWSNGSITVASAQNSLKTLHKLECGGQTPKDQCLNSVVGWWRTKSHIKKELHLLEFQKQQGMLFNCAGYLVAFKNIEFNYVCVPYAGYRFLHILSFKYTVNRNPRVICSVVITDI